MRFIDKIMKACLGLTCVLLLASGCSNPVVLTETAGETAVSSEGRALFYNGTVTLYEHINYGGASLSVQARDGVINLETFNNRVSSIKFNPPPTSGDLIMFDGPDGTGISISPRNFGNLLYDGFNDMASSIAFSNRVPMGRIELYTGKNYTGSRFIVEAANYAYQSFSTGYKSMKHSAPLPYSLKYKLPNGKELYRVVTKGDYPDIEFIGPGSSPLSGSVMVDDSPKIIIYTGTNYTGQASLLDRMDWNTKINLVDYGLNDMARSIRFINCRMELFEHANFTGISRQHSGNVPALGTFAGIVSSLKTVHYKYSPDTIYYP